MQPKFFQCVDENNQTIHNQWLAIPAENCIVLRKRDPVTGEITYDISDSDRHLQWRAMSEKEMEQHGLSDGSDDEIYTELGGEPQPGYEN